MEKSNRFSDVFDKLSFSDKVEKRITNLIKSLSTAISSGSDLNTFVRIYDWKGSTDQILEILKNSSPECVQNLGTDPPSVTFSAKNGQKIVSDYICVEYKRLYFIPADRASLRRFLYFEIYYDEYIVSCLMDAPSFHKNAPMDALEMDNAEWAHAKLQMKLWNQVFLPDIEEIDFSDMGPLYQPVLQRLEAYSSLWDADIPEIFSLSEPIWVLLTYLHLLQTMPFLPQNQVPCYAVCFVCTKNTDIFVQRLREFLSEYWQPDPIMNVPISESQIYLKREQGKDTVGAVQPYILRPNRSNSKDIQAVYQDVLDYARTQSKNWEQHPFLNAVPIIVVEEAQRNQHFLNIPVESNMEFPDAADVRNRFLRFWYQLKRHFLSYNRVKRKKLKASYGTMDKLVAEQLTEKVQMDQQPYLYSLCVWFCLMYRQESIVNKKIKLTEADTQWLHDLENSRKKKDATLESAVDDLLKSIAEEWRLHPGTMPKSKESWDQNDLGFIKVDIADDSCLIRKPEYFKELIKQVCPEFHMDDVIEYLVNGKYLRTNKKESTCVYKIEKDKSVKTYALYCNRLPM
jgi:hypothetical protein